MSSIISVRSTHLLNKGRIRSLSRIWIHNSDYWIRIREAQKDADPDPVPDPDPQLCLQRNFSSFKYVTCYAGGAGSVHDRQREHPRQRGQGPPEEARPRLVLSVWPLVVPRGWRGHLLLSITSI